MAKVRIHELARELGLPASRLVQLAQSLGLTVTTHVNTLDAQKAEELKGAVHAMAAAGYHHRLQHGPEGESDPESGPAPSQGPQEALMLVSMGQHDVRVSESYELGFNNMVKVVSALLADLKQTVRTEDETVSWGNLYFLRMDRSTTTFGTIELEYGDETVIKGESQRQKGILGDILWSAMWLNEDWKRPFIKLSQVIGLSRDPEGDYRNQLESDLRALEAQGRIVGLTEWEITTGIPGRNIYISPKAEYVP